MWFRLSSGTRRAPGIRDETSTALSNVVDRSPIAWRTIVGARIVGISSTRSTSWRAIRLATALLGDVDIRWRSSNHSSWDSVASGMNFDVKTRRNVGSSFAQPTRIMLRYVSSTALSSGVNTTGSPQTVPYRMSRVTRSGWAAA